MTTMNLTTIVLWVSLFMGILMTIGYAYNSKWPLTIMWFGYFIANIGYIMLDKEL